MTEQLAEAAERRAGGRGGGADPELLAEPWPRLPGSPFGALCGRVRDPSSGRGNGGAVTVAGPGAGTSATWCRDRASPSRASPSKPEQAEQAEQAAEARTRTEHDYSPAAEGLGRGVQLGQLGACSLAASVAASSGTRGPSLVEGRPSDGAVRRGTFAARRGGSGARAGAELGHTVPWRRLVERGRGRALSRAVPVLCPRGTVPLDSPGPAPDELRSARQKPTHLRGSGLWRPGAPRWPHGDTGGLHRQPPRCAAGGYRGTPELRSVADLAAQRPPGELGIPSGLRRDRIPTKGRAALGPPRAARAAQGLPRLLRGDVWRDKLKPTCER